MKNPLRQLYESTAEDLLYGVGLLHLPGAALAPLIQIHYRDWSRAQLEIVRASFDAGLTLVSRRGTTGTCDLYIATREQVALHQKEGGDTSILRAPAWDAHLAEVEAQAHTMFESNRRRCGGFLLLLQTPDWEFVTVIDEAADPSRVGAITPRSLPVPPAGVPE